MSKGEPAAVRNKARGKRPVDRLARDEPAARGLLRLLASEINASVDDLKAIDPQTAPPLVHRIRKRLKKSRTIVRVLRPALGVHAESLGTRLRDATRALAGSRDATVLAATAARLAQRTDDPEQRALLERIAVEARQRAEAHHHTPADLDAAMAGIVAARQILAKLRISREADEPVVNRAALTYRRARRGWHAAEEHTDVDTLHDWRKRVKDRLHVARLFQDRWPERRDARTAKLDRLGELLGDDHDLALVAEALPADGAAAEALRAAIEARRARLADKAFDMARELFAERPRRVLVAWREAQGARTR
jgi:CHAD domain-containing protein